MAKKPKKTTMSVSEAVENLSSMAEMDDKVLKEERARQGEIDPFERRLWLDLTNEERTYQTVKETFGTIHRYLKQVYRDGHRDAETQRGVHAIMELAGEAATKMGRCTGLFKQAHRNEDLSELPEYQDLHRFYYEKIVKRFERELIAEESWQEEWGEEVEEDLMDIERRGLKELEQVRKDRKYELFYIRKEDGKPFFNRNLIRHIRLVTDFDEMLIDKYGDDPLIKIRSIQDRECHHSAKEIYNLSDKPIQKFCKDACKFKDFWLGRATLKAFMALTLAANHRNLLSNSAGKSCIGYFKDFLDYLREAVSSVEYVKILGQSKESLDSLRKSTLELLQRFSHSFYTHAGKRDDAIGYLFQIVRQSGRRRTIEYPAEPLTIWNSILENHDDIRNLLRKYPNGPLLKLIDLFEEREQTLGFDPLFLENFPSHLFDFSMGKKKISLLRIPAPVYQEQIGSAKILNEFKAFLRECGKKRLLLFNLQDRTSWEEHGRAESVEKIAKDFPENLTVITLPKNTPFYQQIDEYFDLDASKDFLTALQEQIKGAEECGFYFPESIDRKELLVFATKAVPYIHKAFFDQAASLNRKNRLDFIEITWQFLIIKLIELIGPEYVSFTCKDAIDVGQIQTMHFYSFLKLMSNEEISEEESDFILWMVFAPALIIRNRVVDIHRLSRALSGLSVLSKELQGEDRKKTDAAKLYKSSPFSKAKESC